MDVDWDEEGLWRMEELQKQMEEGIPVSAWQMCQINQVANSFPDVFSETPGKAQGVQHKISTTLGR